MPSSIYYPGNGHAKPRAQLPLFSSALPEKLTKRRTQTPPPYIRIPLPFPRRVLVIPNPFRAHHFFVVRFGLVPGTILLFFALVSLLLTAFAFGKRYGSKEKQWPTTRIPFMGDPPTLVYTRSDLQKIWEWEVASGHYPSRRPIPEQIGFAKPIRNPGVPPYKTNRFKAPPGIRPTTDSEGVGAQRVYLDIQSRPPNVAYPPRPVPGSAADLDIVMDNCDFSENKYVRDCLEVLRVGAGLDNGQRLRRGEMDDWKYIYMEQPDTYNVSRSDAGGSISPITALASEGDPNSGLNRRWGVDWEPSLKLRPPVEQHPYSALPEPCDPENPRIFHMFWTGPFTDKPYMALLSFLFTQNTGLHLDNFPSRSACRPQFWLWINPGPAASVPNPNVVREMFDGLKDNPWAAPFLHPRFKDVIHFKMWNTTEQLDGVPELKDEWRHLDSLFNSGGHVMQVPKKQEEQSSSSAAKKDDDDMMNRLGSKSASSYDRLSVILSDMARFVLCHRFGGIYLDADTIFLRDWEELWGWKGAFAYRWSRLPKYNTAVLKLNKQSALGTFLFRTALKNNMDFHPMTVARYTKDAYLEPLLLRLPDALFDSAWLNTEDFQRDRPPQPYLTDFSEFFETPAQSGGAPLALGFDGFYKGAYSYHFHNYWWKPFDPARNWPDLGERFIAGERQAREALRATGVPAPVDGAEHTADDKRDLDWSTVLKRTFESYIRGERPNMYGEWLKW
ncbi:uncharacterized protein SCHCODRAFT_02612047 [Schizophyllum commune H4-8]|uniref:Glycosyltransferase family 32 protein n=1 Tax=Schizophyllum commune (strain H4-8 / FGSC 9210) TaxID=578458 RepID=D8PPA2_SCHCM|nr:uncharacterized protein SCHCODRAFT_02612047 [Schizophyllum commune H4-8]KAI5898419.1 hypothetical protein SCHCODRAFT_02612047 [Schizophyllum commune H4-8]